MDQAYFDYLDASLELQNSLHGMEKFLNDSDNLQNLKTAVEQYGLPKALLAFVNVNDGLTRVVPVIPSIESLSELEEINVEEALEGIFGSIKETLGRWVEKWHFFLHKYRKWATAAMVLLGGYVAYMSGLNFAKIAKYEEQLRASGVDLRNVKSEALYHRIDSGSGVLVGTVLSVVGGYCAFFFKNVYAAINDSLSTRLPTQDDDYDKYVEKIRGIFKYHVRLDIKESGSVGEPPMDDHHHSDKPITVAELKEAVDNITHAIDQFKRSEYVPEKLQKLANSDEVKTPTGQKAFMFLSRTIQHVMKLNVDTMHKTAAATKQVADHIESAAKKAE